MALCLRSVVERFKSYAPVKSHTAAIAFHQKVNQFGHLPTRSPAVNMVRHAAAMHFGLGTRNRKEPFRWDHVVAFALVHGASSRCYCHLMVAGMAVVMFGAMCRYDDVNHLRWRNTYMPTLTYQSCGWSNIAWGPASELGPWPENLQFSGLRD